MPDYRILVTGDRRWTDSTAIRTALLGALARAVAGDAEGFPAGGYDDVVLVHGACHLGGADIIAAQIWESWGMTTEPHPAAITDGRVLGPERNALMVALGADECLAFVTPESRGTRNCIRLAREAGIPVRISVATSSGVVSDMTLQAGRDDEARRV